MALFLLSALFPFLSGCSSTAFLTAKKKPAALIAERPDLRLTIADAPAFKLLVVTSTKRPSKDRLTVFIEGDGFAFSAGRPTNDPTPKDPLGLRIALSSPRDEQIVYLARPCQYVVKRTPPCTYEYWTSHRYSERVVENYMGLIDELMEAYAAKRLRLVGYSGGGALAALIAARRSDVSRLVTLAANLDTEFWTKVDDLTPLQGLNPADEVASLMKLEQFHLIGKDDRVVPNSVSFSYLGRFRGSKLVNYRVMKGFTHTCCWIDAWPDLWKQVGLK